MNSFVVCERVGITAGQVEKFIASGCKFQVQQKVMHFTSKVYSCTYSQDPFLLVRSKIDDGILHSLVVYLMTLRLSFGVFWKLMCNLHNIQQ